MSGATVAYNLRRNKHVERQIFMELLMLLSRWTNIREYLYIGFGGVYFEEFKLLHNLFGLTNMVSIERDEWIIPRQKLNIPYGCIDHCFAKSSDVVSDFDTYKAVYDVKNALIWLDFCKASELASQLNEVRGLISKLEDGDILKVTLSLHTRWLNSGLGSELENRLDNLREKLGSTYLSEGITVNDVTNARIVFVYLNALKRKIAEGLSESPDLEFQPVGCYRYNDGTPMLTVTGVALNRSRAAGFAAAVNLTGSDFTSPNWELHDIDVPDLSLRERLELDQKLKEQTLPEQIASELPFRFEEDAEESLELIRNYVKLHRFYPNYHRIQI
jgi:hypothetical protein